MFELLECNIYEMIKGRRQYLPEPLIKNLMYQLMKAMDHMHKYGALLSCRRPITAFLMCVSNLWCGAFAGTACFTGTSSPKTFSSLTRS